jgi:hypothetical protein
MAGGAGIGGGGSSGAGENILISGGFVLASSCPTGSWTSAGGTGAGIGGGAGGSGGSVTVSGGAVIAASGTGAGIGGGAGGSGGTFTTGSRNPVIFAASISDTTTDALSIGSGQGVEDSATIDVFYSASGPSYMAGVTLTGDFTVPFGAVFTLPPDLTLIVNSGNTLTNDGTVINNGDVYESGGTIIEGVWIGAPPR